MKRLKLLALAAFAFALSLAIAGCGGSGGGAADANSATTAPSGGESDSSAVAEPLDGEPETVPTGFYVMMGADPTGAGEMTPASGLGKLNLLTLNVDGTLDIDLDGELGEGTFRAGGGSILLDWAGTPYEGTVQTLDDGSTRIILDIDSVEYYFER